MFGAAKQNNNFKDYCLILQVHPEADAAMIDAAYWHLAKRYNQAASYDPNAKSKLEELNEAYIVLGSAQRRDEYMQVRAQVLGEGALPQAPGPVPATPPLSVMTRQRPEERAQAMLNDHKRRLPMKRIALGAVAILGLIGIALLAALSVLTALAVGAVALGTILAVTAIVAALPTLRAQINRSRLTGAVEAGSLTRSAGAKLKKVEEQAAPLRAVIESIDAVPDVVPLARAERPGPIQAIETPMERPFAAPPEDELTPELEPAAAAEPQGMSRGQIDQIKKQAAAYRRIADNQPRENDAAPDEPAQVDPAEADKIRAQTERLKAIAEKFNAAKAQSRPQTQDEDQTA